MISPSLVPKPVAKPEFQKRIVHEVTHETAKEPVAVLLFRRCRLGRLRSGETVGNGTDNQSVPTPDLRTGSSSS
ncbi:MAG: hypothetical protein WCL08_07820 [Verrucomicrobiota bacterium]